MVPSFEAHTMVGLCYKKGDHLIVQGHNKEWDLTSILCGLEGREVRYLFQYLPEGNPDPSKWGLGCCRWQPSDGCPAHHHEHPHRMLDECGVGRVCRTQQGQHGALSEGRFVVFPLPLLAGHRCRVAFVTLFDVDAARDQISVEGLSSIEELLEVAVNAQEELARIKQAMGDS